MSTVWLTSHIRPFLFSILFSKYVLYNFSGIRGKDNWTLLQTLIQPCLFLANWPWKVLMSFSVSFKPGADFITKSWFMLICDQASPVWNTWPQVRFAHASWWSNELATFSVHSGGSREDLGKFFLSKKNKAGFLWTLPLPPPSSHSFYSLSHCIEKALSANGACIVLFLLACCMIIFIVNLNKDLIMFYFLIAVHECL